MSCNVSSSLLVAPSGALDHGRLLVAFTVYMKAKSLAKISRITHL